MGTGQRRAALGLGAPRGCLPLSHRRPAQAPPSECPYQIPVELHHCRIPCLSPTLAPHPRGASLGRCPRLSTMKPDARPVGSTRGSLPTLMPQGGHWLFRV